MSEELTSIPLSAAKNLRRPQYDAWGIRTALISRGLPTMNFPGDVVFTEQGGPDSLAFTQLASYGTTYGGMGIVRKQEDTDLILRRAGISAAVGEQPDGRHIRALVHAGDVLALSGGDHREALNVDDVDPSVLGRAAEGVHAVSGIELAAVSLVEQAPGPEEASDVLVTGISHTPHLRDFSGGSRARALELAQQLVERTAATVGRELPEPVRAVRVHIEAEGAAAPETFGHQLQNLVVQVPKIRRESVSAGPSDVGITLSGPPGAVALVVTRALTGLETGDFAQLVITEPLIDS